MNEQYYVFQKSSMQKISRSKNGWYDSTTRQNSFKSFLSHLTDIRTFDYWMKEKENCINSAKKLLNNFHNLNLKFHNLIFRACQVWWLRRGCMPNWKKIRCLVTNINHFEVWGLEKFTRNIFLSHPIHFSHSLIFKTFTVLNTVLNLSKYCSKKFALFRTRRQKSTCQDVSKGSFLTV